MKKILLLIIFVLVFTVLFAQRANAPKTQVIIGNTAFDSIVSDTPELREKGLSGHRGLRDDEAMLFVFEKPDLYGFWMKDMLFPIDILWLDENYRVISFEKNIATSTYPKSFYPKAPALYVLEVNGGTLERLRVTEGDSVFVSGGK